MHLDMPTISAVTISVTGILGLLLVFAWWRDRSSALTGWWGVAQLVMSGGIVLAVIASVEKSANVSAFAQAAMILSTAIMWMAVRQFEGRRLHPLWVLVLPAAFLLAHFAGLFETFDQRLIVVCTAMAGLCFAAAVEFGRDPRERLSSRWPTVIVLIATGAGYLTWLPLTLTMPIGDASLVFYSSWFPKVVLVATLGRLVLAFLVLAIVKERQELKQRIDALTDPLTGLPNRRALFEAADRLALHSKYLKGDPISVLVFDLDHFKKINDRFGHRLGDRVLQLFADILAERLETGSIVGRLGGEEFAAILPGADIATAGVTAESVRVAFARSAAFFDGMPVAGTVSVGAASHDDIDCDLGTLFHRADGALYAAKNGGRNRVELLGPLEPAGDRHASSAAAHWLGVAGTGSGALEKWGNLRRYRGAKPLADPAPRARRRGPALS
jgi:diguanylate cyclase (GGDEF)-like protein